MTDDDQQDSNHALCRACGWGVYEATGENIVITMDGHRPAFRVRTAARRPIQERWSSAAIMCVVATPRVPDPRAPGRSEIATPKQAGILADDGLDDDDDDSDDDEREDHQGAVDEDMQQATGDGDREEQLHRFLSSLKKEEARESGFYEE